MTYKLTFFDYWHTGSGESGGALTSAYVAKDSDGLPYVGGKTLKGLLREMANLIDEKVTVECFGTALQEGLVTFSSCVVADSDRKPILARNLQPYLFERLAATAINENGVAKEGSLREIEVVVPLTLTGVFENVPAQHKPFLKKAALSIKRMGLGRHRGLGRCQFTFEEIK